MQCGQNVQLLHVKLLVNHVTSRVEKVKYEAQTALFKDPIRTAQ